MPKINKRLAGPIQMPGSATTVYTSPVNTRTTITHIHLVNGAASPAASFVMSIGAIGSYTVLHVARSGTDRIAASGGLFDDHGPYTLEPGEVIQVTGDTTLALTINGYTEST